MSKNKKKIDLKSLIFGTPTKAADNSNPFSSEGFVPVSDIKNGVVSTKDGRYIKILEILPVNFHLKSITEQQNIIYYFASYLKIAPDNLQILVCTGRANIDAWCAQMESFYNSERNESCREMILENAELVNDLAANEAVSRKFYLVFPYSGGASEFEQISDELEAQAQTARQYLESCGLEVAAHEDYDDFLFKTLYSALNRSSAQQNTPREWRAMTFAALGGDEDESADAEGRLMVSELLAPSECGFTHKEYVIIDGTYHSYLYIAGYGYPTGVPLSWLSPLAGMGDGISLSFQLERRRKESILPKIAKTTMINRSRMRDIGDTRADYEQLDDAISSGIYMKDEMNRNGEDFYYIHTLIEVVAEDLDVLNARIKQVENLCGSLDLAVRKADYKHEQSFLSMLPLCSLDVDIARKSRRNALTHGVAAAFPFSCFELCDDSGVFLGINMHNSSAVILNNFDSSQYSNGNLAIFGMSGAGKTYTMTVLALRMRMQDVQVMIIAPEKGFEYMTACEAVGGQFIKIAAGSQDCINIMEIRRVTLDIDEDLRGKITRTDSVLLDKIQQLHTYFSLADPDITKEQHHQLDAAIFETYRQFSVNRDNQSLLNDDGSIKDMPDLSHLLWNVKRNPDLKSVALTIQRLIDMGLGGQTNVRLTSKYIVLDVSKMPKEFVSLGMFTATAFVKDTISTSRISKKAVFMDEGWKIAGERGNEDASDFVIELVKTIRGYGGCFISATQNVIDYFTLQNGKFGKSLLGNSRLKLLLQMEEAEAAEIKDELGLSDEETLQITRSGRGQGLLCAGSNRIGVEIRSTQKEYDLITTQLSDLEARRK
jgi:hypothetical protein